MPELLPSKLLQSLQPVAGFNESSFVQAHSEGNRITSIRFHPIKMFAIASSQRDEVLQSCINLAEATAVPWCANAYYLAERPSFTFDPLFHAGLYYVQEASSLFLWQVLTQTVGGDTKDKKVLDLCAAPGGKSTLLSAYFYDGMVVANEVIKSRANILSENITKWGSGNVVVSNNDPAYFQRLANFFDVMVADAPCSGSGLFRKDASAINEWSEEAVMLCSARQQRIVADAFATLRQQGILIYSTCSYSPAENEDILDWMLDNFSLTPLRLTLSPEWGIIETTSARHKAYGYRFYPDKVKGEGFFIAAFRKEEGGSFYASQNAPATLPNREAEQWQPWLCNKTFALMKQKESVIAMPQLLHQNLGVLQKALYLKQAGIALGEVKGKDVIPHHALAVSHIKNIEIPVVSLDNEQAIRYLQKKEIDIDLSALPKGWQLATCCGIGLGWLKVLPNRINNYYPAEWRILKN